MAPHRREIAATLSLLFLAGGGCAGGNSSGSRGSRDFARQANRVCSDAARRAAMLPSNGAQSPAAQLDTYTRQNAISRDEATRLRALMPPPGRLVAYRKYLADIDRRNALDDQIVTALKRGDAGLGKSLANRAKANNNAGQATSLGLSECAKLDAG